MRIRIQLITLVRIRIGILPFNLKRIRIWLITSVRIRIRILPFNLKQIYADSDPQHCSMCNTVLIQYVCIFISGIDLVF
jgi:hypothetical protein